MFKAENSAEWVQRIQSVVFQGCPVSVEHSFPRPHFLVLINPVGGKGEAVRKWNTVHPLFEACAVTVISTLYPATTHRNHASELLTTTDTSAFTAVVTCSGDGLVHEVVNALCTIGNTELPVAALPGGSANAMACVMCDRSGLQCSLFNSAFAIIRGRRTRMDVTRLQGIGESPVYSFLSVAWGFIADVDIGSERFRWLGSMRFDIYGFWKLLRLKRYNGRLTIYGESGEIVESGGFLYFLSCNLPFIGTDMHVAPRAQIDDGCNDLLFVRAENVGRFGLAKVLLKQDGGEHLNLRQLQYVKCRRWALAPTSGIYSIDGELYPARDITAEVMQGAISTLALKNG